MLGRLGQWDTPIDWYSGGHGFSPRSGHISFVEIWSQNNFYGHSKFATASRAVVSYWQKYGHLVLVSLGSLLRNNVERLTDGLTMILMGLTGPLNHKNKQTKINK